MSTAESVFREVADLGEPERAAYYASHVVPPELQAEVESLLRFDVPQGGALTDCVAGVAQRVLGERARERCGPYVLDRLLGRGGMGLVFLAHRADGEVEQRVAIKLVRNAAEEPAFRDRFLQERQILASLSHPGIARLLDAGHTPSGQPYLALEYVEGIPIDAYCRELELRPKLELFLKVCEALSYAHRNLVIHRDLKPSNILVEASGQPKLLDFGIARILDDETGGGMTQERLLTPDFASPEQVRGNARTTATDIYSLGAVLYQILTGQSPHAATKGVDESEEMRICTRSVEPPSRVNPALPRDLDFILGKALRKEPEARYVAVDSFADDIRALLESRPVLARSGNAWYHTMKFLRRRWLPAAAIGVALVGLSVGLYTANRQRAAAQRRFSQLRQLANKVLQLDTGLRALPGSTKVRQQVVSAGIEYLDGLGEEARGDQQLAMEVVNGYLALAEVQGVPTVPNLGQFVNAEGSLRKADKIIKGVLAEDSRNAEALGAEAEIEQDQMILADSQHHEGNARGYAQQCADTLDRLMEVKRAAGKKIESEPVLYFNVGQSYMNRHESDAAIRYARSGIELARIPGVRPQYLAVGLSLLATALRQAGDVEGAVAPITEARGLAESTKFSDESARAMSLYTILWRQGQILGSDEGISLGRADAAIEPLQKAFDLMEQQASKDPNDATSRDREAMAAWQLGDVLRHRDPVGALAVFDRAVMRQRESKGNLKARREEARLLARSSYPLCQLHRLVEAKQRIDSAFELLRATKDYPAAKVELGDAAEAVLRAEGDLAEAGGQTGAAIGIYRGLLDRVMASQPKPEVDLRQATDLSRIYWRLSALYSREGLSNDAARFDKMRRDLWRGWDRKLPRNSFVQRQLE